MRVLLYRIQSSGPDPFKLKKQKKQKLGPPKMMCYFLMRFCFSYCVMHDVLRYLLLFDLMFT